MASINLTLPDDMLEIIERERASMGETQSEFFVRLIDAFAERQKEAEDIERYKRGYEKYPETEEEIALSMALAHDALEASPLDKE